MNREKNFPLPWWGVLVLAPGIIVSAYVAMMIGADCLASAYWGNGIVWAMWILLSLGGVFWLSRLASPQWALILIIGYVLVVGFGAQVQFWDLAHQRVYRSVQHDHQNYFPEDWKGLSQAALYQAWIIETLQEPGPHAWWSHLRAQAVAGISNYERATQFEPGKSGYRAVYRDGFWVWFAWMSQYVFMGIAGVISLAGCAVWNNRVQQEQCQQQFVKQVMSQVGDALKARGVNAETARRIIQQSSQKKVIDSPINHQRVADLMPGLPEQLIQDISLDIEYNRQWRKHWDPDRVYDERTVTIVEDIVLRFYNGDERLIDARPSWMYVLVAAWRLEQNQQGLEYSDALQRIYDVVLALGHRDQIPPFRRFCLKGLIFKQVAVGEEWASLAVRHACFFERDSVWERLVVMEPQQIPEEAYLGILYQYYFTPDRRVYEFWAGIEPHDLVQALGARLRDALLTFIEREQQAFADHRSSYMEGMLSMVGAWPYAQAAPLLELAMQSGWRASLSQIPESEEWEQFLERHERSAFGSPRAYVKWFDQKKYRAQRGG